VSVVEHHSDAGTVTAALEALDGIEDVPVPEHLPAYERAHAELRAALEI
jgi:hypothetical protein